VISIVSARAAVAALDHAGEIVPARRAKIAKTRNELCSWLKASGTPYIEPSANFMMIDVSPRDCRYYIPRFAERGVAVGRPFPPLENMLRVSIGTDADMARFKEVFGSLRA
jgi:histidinol-phosphate/aromatic aminotransferase/cobyric acid decarboxylase-like protein